MVSRRIIRWLFPALLLLSNCNVIEDTADPLDGGRSSESDPIQVSGIVWRNGPLSDISFIVIHDSEDIYTGQTDLNGRFSFSLESVSGRIEIRSPDSHLRQRIDIQEGTEVSDVLLSPIGTLAEAYADAPNITRGDALRAISDFFSVPLRGDQLISLETSFISQNCSAVNPPVRAGVVQDGLRFLGEVMGSEDAAPADEILLVLEQDLVADGLLDGQGPQGALSFNGEALTPLTLRTTYTDALRSFLDSPRNKSGLGRACFAEHLSQIENSHSPLFPSATWLGPHENSGCARCRRLESGALDCTPDHSACGSCGICQLDTATDPPVGVCVAEPSECQGSCSVCTETPDGGYACGPSPNICEGSCGTCQGSGTNYNCLGQSSLCSGNCATCTQKAPLTFECAEDDQMCAGTCGECQQIGADFLCSANPSLCPGSATDACSECKAVSDIEFECIDNNDLCPEPQVTHGECGNFMSICGETGTLEQKTTTFACQEGSCRESVQSNTLPCTRDTDGKICISESCSDFSPCRQVSNGDRCTNEGEKHRLCREYFCQFGSCEGLSQRDDTQSCTYDSDRIPCGTRTCNFIGSQKLCCMNDQCNTVCGACL